MNSEVEVWLEVEKGDVDTIAAVTAPDAEIQWQRLPAERSGSLPMAIEPAVVVLAWTGAATGAAAALSWLHRRTKRGVVIDARHKPIRIRQERALHPGQLVIIDAEGRVTVHDVGDAPNAIDAAIKALKDD